MFERMSESGLRHPLQLDLDWINQQLLQLSVWVGSVQRPVVAARLSINLSSSLPPVLLTD